MKLFGIIFSAILAAAAVIWGISQYSDSQKANTAKDLRMLETMVGTAKITAESAVTYGKIQELTLNVTLDGAKDFERILRAGRVDRAKARTLAFNYVYDYREVIKVIREKIPRHARWADEMEPLLQSIEAASKSL